MKIYLLLFVVMFSFCQCGKPIISIEELVTNAPKYSKKEVTIEGEIIASVNLISLIKCYRIKDHTGTLLVKTHKNVPLEGTIIKVTGTLVQLHKTPDNHLIYLSETKEKK